VPCSADPFAIENFAERSVSPRSLPFYMHGKYKFLCMYLETATKEKTARPFSSVRIAHQEKQNHRRSDAHIITAQQETRRTKFQKQQAGTTHTRVCFFPHTHTHARPPIPIPTRKKKKKEVCFVFRAAARTCSGFYLLLLRTIQRDGGILFHKGIDLFRVQINLRVVRHGKIGKGNRDLY
jgi:hypothetical protein